jgi:hypothetical protein
MGEEEKETKLDCADSGFAGVADHLGKPSISDTPLEFTRRGYTAPSRCVNLWMEPVHILVSCCVHLYLLLLRVRYQTGWRRGNAALCSCAVVQCRTNYQRNDSGVVIAFSD